VDSFGDLDILEEVAIEIDTNLEGILSHIKNDNHRVISREHENGRKVKPIRRRILLPNH
jgi:hypothetical protein